MRTVLLSMLLVHSLALAGCRHDRGVRSPDGGSCEDFKLSVEEFWSASVRAEVLGRGGEIEASHRRGLVNRMDAIAQDWVMLRTSTCKDFVERQTLTREEYNARVGCFDAHLHQQRQIAELLASGQDAVADSVLTALAPVAECQR